MLPLLLTLQAAPVATPASAQPAAGPDVEHIPPDWAATLRTDARALNDDIAVNHPGLANDGIPMKVKVYRGRPRGYNEPVVPTHRFDGDITDPSALERWIATLPR